MPIVCKRRKRDRREVVAAWFGSGKTRSHICFWPTSRSQHLQPHSSRDHHLFAPFLTCPSPLKGTETIILEENGKLISQKKDGTRENRRSFFRVKIKRKSERKKKKCPGVERRRRKIVGLKTNKARSLSGIFCSLRYLLLSLCVLFFFFFFFFFFCSPCEEIAKGDLGGLEWGKRFQLPPFFSLSLFLSLSLILTPPAWYLLLYFSLFFSCSSSPCRRE